MEEAPETFGGCLSPVRRASPRCLERGGKAARAEPGSRGWRCPFGWGGLAVEEQRDLS